MSTDERATWVRQATTEAAGRCYAWRRADENVGHSVARVAEVEDGWVFHATEVLIGGGAASSCAFHVKVDTGWCTRAVSAVAVSITGETALDLRADGSRRWWRSGKRAPDLDECVDVDVAATPLTNTFAIRRLAGLAVGQRSTSPVAWVEVPSLEVSRVDQSYRRIAPRRWEYSDPKHGAFVLDVDDDGIVETYEGFAVRVPL